MILKHQLECLSKLGEYMLSEDPSWREAKEKAFFENGWFIPEFIELASKNIAEKFLKIDLLESWVQNYHLPPAREQPKSIGIVMAGNIPLVGFHDLLSVFISGHKAVIKPSSKDSVLIQHLANHLIHLEPKVADRISFSEILKNCNAYIATGSNNTSRYFEYYFGKYPHIIRRNKSSLGFIMGDETTKELEGLADDVCQFFGLGCRNVTKILVPVGYDFEPLLSVFNKYQYLVDHHKYRNNYDYNLAIHILNNKFYMTNGAILLSEDPSLFSPISQLNFEYYSHEELALSSVKENPDIQSIIGRGQIPFGQAQSPGLFDYADNVDIMAFLSSL